MRATLLILCLALLVVAVAATSARVTLYNRDSAPLNWERLGRATPFARVSFDFALIQHNWEEFTRRAIEISSPSHENYLEHMTVKEIADLTGPTAAELEVVYRTLESYGIPRSATELKNGDYLKVTATVRAAEALFATRFHTFRHTLTGQSVIKQFGEYSVPAEMNAVVQMIFGVSTFPAIEGKMIIRNAKNKLRRLAKAGTPGQTTPAWIPQAIANIYTFPTGIQPGATPDISAGPIEFISETFNQTDLNVFGQQVGVPVVQPTPAHIYGNSSTGQGALEASLDIQWIEGINPGYTPWFWLEASDYWLYQYTTEALAVGANGPQVISMSYGLPEVMQCSYFNNDTCQPLGVDYVGYVLLTNKQFMKMAAIGITSIVCSQDRGVYEPHLIPNYPGNNVNQGVQPFEPEYPGTSDWVTSVGATEFASPVFNVPNPPPACQSSSWQCVSSGYEQAVSYPISFYKSGGGFSSVTNRPFWQAYAVNAYLMSNVTLPPMNISIWNSTSRGFPDIAALGYNAIIIDQGGAELVSGTSLSTPIIAAIFAYLAEQFFQMTGKQLGFLTPLLYQAAFEQPNVFHDIVTGDNCQSTPCAGTGFFAAPGWDPVTGLGSPMYANWKSYLNQLAEKVNARTAAKKARQQ